MNGQAMSPQLELKDFAKAYDGPPTDPKVFEEQQKKLQEELQKRAEERAQAARAAAATARRAGALSALFAKMLKARRARRAFRLRGLVAEFQFSTEFRGR